MRRCDEEIIKQEFQKLNTVDYTVYKMYYNGVLTNHNEV